MLICKVSGRSKNPGSFKTYLFSFKNGTRKSLKNENSNSTTGKYLDLRVKTMRTENILCNLNSNSSREKGDRNLKLSTTFSTYFSCLFIKIKKITSIFRKSLGDVGEQDQLLWLRISGNFYQLCRYLDRKFNRIKSTGGKIVRVFSYRFVPH